MPYVDYLATNTLSFHLKHGSSSTLHFDKPCLGYILKGKCEILYKGKTYFAEAGDLMYIAKGTNYSSFWTGDPEIEFYSVPFKFTDPYAMDAFKFQLVKNYPRDKFDRLYAISEEDTFLRLEAFYSLLSELYTKLQKNKKGRAYDSILPAISYIEQNCTEKLYVEHLASLCNLSPSRFFAVFKETVGNTPVGYKNAIRIQKGMELLYETDMTVEQISEVLNFSSPAHFRKQFSKLLGVTPKEVRK
ncbi:MAG: helix-turn-helix domain-containing protein [Clostridia bacterium]|nr:helix-turn-helix domain-containing protein [Clostridia bacterium]